MKTSVSEHLFSFSKFKTTVALWIEIQLLKPVACWNKQKFLSELLIKFDKKKLFLETTNWWNIIERLSYQLLLIWYAREHNEILFIFVVSFFLSCSEMWQSTSEIDYTLQLVMPEAWVIKKKKKII